MAEQTGQLPHVNSLNGNTVPVVNGGPMHVVARVSDSDLTGLDFNRFLVAKNSMELHKKKNKLHNRPNQSLPSVFGAEEYANVKPRPPPSVNVNKVAGKSSMATLKNKFGPKKRVEWADGCKSRTNQLVTAKTFDSETMDILKYEMEWNAGSGGESDSEPFVSILRPQAFPVTSSESRTCLTLTLHSLQAMNNLVENTQDVHLTDNFTRPEVKWTPAATNLNLNEQQSVCGGFEYERSRSLPFQNQNPFNNFAQTLNLAKSHMRSNYESLRTEAPVPLGYYSPRNAAPDVEESHMNAAPCNGSDGRLSVAADVNSLSPSPLMGQYCPFLRPGQGSDDSTLNEYPPQFNKGVAAHNNSVADFPTEDNDNGDNAQNGDLQISPSMDDNDDDELLLEPDKNVEPRLPHIEEMWIPTVANVAMSIPPEQHHLIEVNYKKDCRTWLWKSTRQREERYMKPEHPSS